MSGQGPRRPRLTARVIEGLDVLHRAATMQIESMATLPGELHGLGVPVDPELAWQLRRSIEVLRAAARYTKELRRWAVERKHRRRAARAEVDEEMQARMARARASRRGT